MQDAEVNASIKAADAQLARDERRALRLAALGAFATILWLMSPVATGMLLGVLLAFTFRPIYVRLANRWPASAASLATVLGSTLAIAATFGGLVWILVGDGTVLAGKVVDSLGPGGGVKKVLLAAGELTSRVGVSSDELEAKVRTLVLGTVARVDTIAQAVASTTGSVLLAIFFQMLTMFFVLRHWHPIVLAAQNTLPLRPEHTLKLLDEFRRVGRTTLLSTVVIGLVQGVLGAIGYAIVGLPQPLFFGALTAMASLVPGVGTMLVWVPAGIALLIGRHVAGGIFLLAWGVVVLTSIPNYILLPRLLGIGRGSHVPTLFTFIALFGGAAVLGLKGLVVGPVLMTMAFAILRIYVAEEHEHRSLASASS